MYYWPQAVQHGAMAHGYVLNGRAELAFKLIGTYGAIAGQRGDEDSSGKSALELQTPQELVARCFEIARLFFEEVEVREWVKSVSPEDLARAEGKLEAIIQKSASEELVGDRVRRKS